MVQRENDYGSSSVTVFRKLLGAGTQAARSQLRHAMESIRACCCSFSPQVSRTAPKHLLLWQLLHIRDLRRHKNRLVPW
jgi:hypothetical protein